MTNRPDPRLELVRLSDSLQHHAIGLQSDANAAFMLVHKAMARAFQQPADRLAALPLEETLRQDIDRAYAAGARRDDCFACA
jgi:hypothetical protein